jgi:hypothetical protein
LIRPEIEGFETLRCGDIVVLGGILGAVVDGIVKGSFMAAADKNALGDKIAQGDNIELLSDRIVLVDKCSRPMPSVLKGFHIRQHNRVLDFIINPCIKQPFYLRAKILNILRSYWDDLVCPFYHPNATYTAHPPHPIPLHPYQPRPFTS